MRASEQTDLTTYFEPAAEKLGSWLFLGRGEATTVQWASRLLARSSLAGRGAAAGVYHTPEGSPPGGLSGPGAWVLHMPAVGLVVDDRGRMKQLVLGYPWAAASRCSSLIEATSFHSLPVNPVPWMWEAKPDR